MHEIDRLIVEFKEGHYEDTRANGLVWASMPRQGLVEILHADEQNFPTISIPIEQFGNDYMFISDVYFYLTKKTKALAREMEFVQKRFYSKRQT